MISVECFLHPKLLQEDFMRILTFHKLKRLSTRGWASNYTVEESEGESHLSLALLAHPSASIHLKIVSAVLGFLNQ